MDVSRPILATQTPARWTPDDNAHDGLRSQAVVKICDTCHASTRRFIASDDLTVVVCANCIVRGIRVSLLAPPPSLPGQPQVAPELRGKKPPPSTDPWIID